MSRAKRSRGDEFDDFEPFADRDFDDDRLPGGGAPPRSRKQAAWQRLEQHKDVRRLRAELEDWEDWDELDSV